MKTRRSKAAGIPRKVKESVWERDRHACIWCGGRVNVMPNAHVISRARGGLGVEQNIVTACTNFTVLRCHDRYDNGSYEDRKTMYDQAVKYLKRFYPDWDASRYLYNKAEHLLNI